MAVERFALGDPAEVGGARAGAGTRRCVGDRARSRQIVADVRGHGDAALEAYVERFDDVRRPAARGRRGAGRRARRPRPRRARRPGGGDRQRARGGRGRAATTSARSLLPEGQVVRLREVPVRRAAIYVPGGRAPYPSTVVMGVVTARAAGVEEVVVCAPGAHPVILAACALCGADAVFRMGGAHAVAALAYGTESVPRADVIAGPGNLYVQEAKRLVSGDVGHRRLRRALRRARAGRRGRRPGAGRRSTSPPRPSTARARSSAR